MIKDTLGDMVIIPAHQDLILHQTSFDIVYNPTTAVNGTLLSTGGQVDITVPEGGGGGTVNLILIEFTITNSATTACSIVPTPLLLRDVTIYANSGSLFVQTIQGDHLYTDLANLSTDNLVNIGASMNITLNSLFSGANIASNTSQVYYIPIYTSFLTQTNIYMPAIKNGIIFCLNFRPGTDTVTSGTTPTISNLKLHVIGNSLPIEHHSAVIKEYSSSIYDFKYTDCIVNSIPVALSANSSYNFTLSGVQGMMASIFLVFCQETSGATIYTYTDLRDGTFDITDSNDWSLLGNLKSDYYNRSWDWVHQFPNQLGYTNFLYFFSHAASVRSTEDSAVMTGFNYYDNNTRIKITTPIGWNNGSYTVDLFFKHYATLRLINGRIQTPLLS